MVVEKWILHFLNSPLGQTLGSQDDSVEKTFQEEIEIMYSGRITTPLQRDEIDY